MLRFLDMEVYTVEKNNIEYDLLFSFFKRHQKDIVVAYDKGKFYGTISYEMLLNNTVGDIDSCIEQGKYIHSGNDWEILKNIRVA